MEHEFVIGGYYYLLDGTQVILDNWMKTSEGGYKFLVRPRFEGETLGVSGAGGEHHEFLIEYEEYGSQVIVDKIYEDFRKVEVFPAIRKANANLKVLNENIRKRENLIKDYDRTIKARSDALIKVASELISKAEQLKKVRWDIRTEMEQLEEIREEIRIKKEAIEVMKNNNDIEKLLKDSEKLRKLENAGVDNWEWYGEAMKGDADE